MTCQILLANNSCYGTSVLSRRYVALLSHSSAAFNVSQFLLNHCDCACCKKAAYTLTGERNTIIFKIFLGHHTSQEDHPFSLIDQSGHSRLGRPECLGPALYGQ